MAFRIVIDVNDQGQFRVQAPTPPVVTARFLREAHELISAEVIAQMAATILEGQQRVSLAPASALGRLGTGAAVTDGGAPI